MAKRVEQVVKTMLYVAMAALVAMMLIVVANIIGRVAKIPIFGSGELIGMLSVILISLSLSYTAFCQANVVVKFLVSRFSEHGQAIFDVIACLLGIGTIALLVWAGGAHAWRMMLKGETTFLLGLPIAWLRYVFVLGLILVGLVLSLDIVKALARVARK
jgi:TRAP-type C4-dicarboxylate transport system permease small subunit